MPHQVPGVLLHTMSGTELSRVRTEQNVWSSSPRRECLKGQGLTFDKAEQKVSAPPHGRRENLRLVNVIVGVEDQRSLRFYRV
jgi:hypothetical protein